MNITVIRSRARPFTISPESDSARFITQAITADADPGAVIDAYVSTIDYSPHDQYAVVYDDDGSFLWSGPLGYQQPAAVTVCPASWRVSIWGGHQCEAADIFSLLVKDHGNGRHSVQSGLMVLDAEGSLRPDNPRDPALRFPLDQALRIAQDNAATLTCAGLTSAEVFARHQAEGCPDA